MLSAPITTADVSAVPDSLISSDIVRTFVADGFPAVKITTASLAQRAQVIGAEAGIDGDQRQQNVSGVVGVLKLGIDARATAPR